MPTQPLSRATAVAATLVVSLLLASCGPTRTAEEVRREYALKILEGFSVGFSDIHALRADSATHTLFDLTIKSGDTLIKAEQAEIIVDAKRDTISLQLRGVVGADAESGVMTKLDDMRTDPIRLAGSVRD